MKKYKILLFTLVVATSLIWSACSKEQKWSDKLKGKWNVEAIKLNNTTDVDLSDAKHTIEFLGGKRAYTASFKGIYTIDYNDQLLKDISDTFRYDIKDNQIAITSSQTTKVRTLIRFRYILETLNGSELFFNKTPLDTTTAYLKANR